MGSFANVYEQLKKGVIDTGLCTHCGTCSALSEGTLGMQPTDRGPCPLPVSARPVLLPEMAYTACPGKGSDYPALCREVFGAEPENWLIGTSRQTYVGYASNPTVRRNGASGGIITQTLVYLLDQGLINGAVVVRQGQPRPWQAEPIIAQTSDEILSASQSVYAPVPVNTLLERMATFEGILAFVGLPDQVASLRQLQMLGHGGAQKVRYVLGPYVGTNMYFSAIESFLRANGISSVDEIEELRYRDGEWPGHLMIRTRWGRVLTAEKFHYNYLIPFYITQSTLYSVDFTNELTDISVGDAWHPLYETQGGGYSVVVARSQQGLDLLSTMQSAGVLCLQQVLLDDALSMHGHMLDFKKRGAFIRIDWRRAQGKPVPDYGYRPTHIPLSRELVEVVISAVFAICGTHWVRRLAEWIPVALMGPTFDTIRKIWKRLSKPSKRKGLLEVQFQTWSTSPVGNGKLHEAPALSRTGELWRRARIEVGHWLRPYWSFADVGAHWDTTEDYDDINEETYSYFRRFVDGLRLSNLPHQLHILDICARTGNGTLYFHEHGKVGSAVCADVSPRMGATCRQRLQESGFSDFVWLQLFDYPLPLANHTFDAILCFESVEHFPEPERLVHELGRVTKPGGVMILTTPNVLWEPVHALAAITGYHHSEGPHRFVRYRRLLQMIEASGFQIEKDETTVLVPGGPSWLIRIGEWIETRSRHTLMPVLGLRRVLVCRKR